MMKKIIGIFGVPRSGTSWLGQIFNSSPETRFAYQPMFTERFRDQIHPRSSEREMRDYLQKIYEAKEDFLTQNDEMDKGQLLSFEKESEYPEIFVFKEVMYLYMIPRFLRNLPEMKVVLLLRNPFDVLRSWYNAPKEFYPEWDIEKEWLFAQSKNWFLPERYYGYHRWKESIILANELRKEFPSRVYVIRYEDLNENPINFVQEIFRFCGLKWQDQTKEFIYLSRSKTEESPYSIYRSPRDRGYRFKDLPVEVVRRVEEDMNLFEQCRYWYVID